MSNEKKLSERFAEALRNSDMVRMDAKTNTAIISLRIGPGEMDEVLAVLRAAEAKEDAVVDVIAERQRQISEEGWTLEHDDQQVAGEMADVAACYAAVLIEMRVVGNEAGRGCHEVPAGWPRSWSFRWWKPKDRRRDLVRAGALIIAEIERLDRARSAKGEGEENG